MVPVGVTVVTQFVSGDWRMAAGVSDSIAHSNTAG
jgi:hypothetical protein